MEKKRIKQDLYQFCDIYVSGRIARIRKQISAIVESLASETKSSAGDKHETGRAMLHLEREKLGQQLAEAEKMKQLLSKVDINTNTDLVGLGNLVITHQGSYFVAISAGEFKNRDIQVFCISANTPIGKLILKKSIGDTVIFKDEMIEVLEIW